jgi:hypothetical protein
MARRGTGLAVPAFGFNTDAIKRGPNHAVSNIVGFGQYRFA